ncbi:hypothetical protein EGW08_014626 [Elysia chlorotica]|uniref:Uncharacterized protein n=1 Tax=Elysia chlorotica TaxID=188477 RepID=A0A3S1B1K2_ELYCH|nr:hypothetical protein EGW08_014626 [Elysia chlorotica]
MGASTLEEISALPTEKIEALEAEEIRSLTAKETGDTATKQFRALATEEIGIPATEEIEAASTEEIRASTLEETGTPAKEETGAPATEETGDPATEEIGDPATEETGDPATEEIGATATEEIGAPGTGEIAAAATGEIEVPPTEEIGGPATEKVRAPIAEESGVSARDNSGTSATEEIKVCPAEKIGVPEAEKIKTAATEEIGDTATKQCRALGKEEIETASTGEIRVPTTEEIADPATKDFGAPATEEIQVLPTEKMAALEAKETGDTATKQFRALAKEKIGTPATEEIQTSAAKEIRNSAREEIGAAATEESNALPTHKIEALEAVEIGALAAEEISGLPTEKIEALKAEEIGGLTAEAIANTATKQVTALAKDKIGTPATEEIQASATEEVINPAREEFGAPATEKIGAPAKEEIIAPALEETGNQATEKIGALAAEEISGLPTEKIEALEAEEIRSLTAEETEDTATKQFRALATEEIGVPETKEIEVSATKEIGVPATKEIEAAATEKIGTSATEEIENTATEEFEAPEIEEIGVPATEEIGDPTTEEIGAAATGKISALPTHTIEALDAGEIGDLTAEAIGNTATKQFRAIATEEIGVPATEDVEAAATEEIEVPTTEEIGTSAAEKVEDPATEETIAPATEKIEDPTREKFGHPATEEIEAAVTRKIEAPAAKEIGAPALEETGTPATDEIEAAVTKEIEAPAAKEIKDPATEESEVPATEEFGGSTLEETGTPATEEVIAPETKEIEAPAAENIGVPATEEIGAPEREEIGAPTTEGIGAPALEETGTPATEEIATAATEGTGVSATEEIEIPTEKEIGAPAKEEIEIPPTEKIGFTATEKIEALAAEEIGVLATEILKAPATEGFGVSTTEEIEIPTEREIGVPGREETGSLTTEKIRAASPEILRAPSTKEIGTPATEEIIAPEKEYIETPAVEEIGAPATEESGAPVIEWMENRAFEENQCKVSKEIPVKTCSHLSTDSNSIKNDEHAEGQICENGNIAIGADVPSCNINGCLESKTKFDAGSSKKMCRSEDKHVGKIKKAKSDIFMTSKLQNKVIKQTHSASKCDTMVCGRTLFNANNEAPNTIFHNDANVLTFHKREEPLGLTDTQIRSENTVMLAAGSENKSESMGQEFAQTHPAEFASRNDFGEKRPIACSDEPIVPPNKEKMTQENDLMIYNKQSLSTTLEDQLARKVLPQLVLREPTDFDIHKFMDDSPKDQINSSLSDGESSANISYVAFIKGTVNKPDHVAYGDSNKELTEKSNEIDTSEFIIAEDKTTRSGFGAINTRKSISGDGIGENIISQTYQPNEESINPSFKETAPCSNTSNTENSKSPPNNTDTTLSKGNLHVLYNNNVKATDNRATPADSDIYAEDEGFSKCTTDFRDAEHEIQMINAEDNIMNDQNLSPEVKSDLPSDRSTAGILGAGDVLCDMRVPLESSRDLGCQEQIMHIENIEQEKRTNGYAESEIPIRACISKPKRRAPPMVCDDTIQDVLPLNVHSSDCCERICSSVASQGKDILTKDSDAIPAKDRQTPLPERAAADVAESGIEEDGDNDTMSPSSSLDVDIPCSEPCSEITENMKTVSEATENDTAMNVHCVSNEDESEISDSFTTKQGIELKIAPLLQNGHSIENQRQHGSTSFTRNPMDGQGLNTDTKTTPIFPSVKGSANDSLSIEVKDLDRKSKNVPFFAMVNIQAPLPSQNADIVELKTEQSAAQNANDPDENQPSSIHTSSAVDKIVSKFDSFTSSLASINSVESKKSALKTSQKTVSDCTQRPKQRVTFHIKETNAEGILQLDDQTDAESSLLQCHDMQQTSCNTREMFETTDETHLVAKRGVGPEDTAIASQAVEPNLKDSANEEAQDDDSMNPHHIDGNGLMKLADELSLEIDMMDFGNLSNGSEPDKPALVIDGKLRAENEETITDGVCRSTLSDVDEASLHIISSVESLPRDEDAQAALCEAGADLQPTEQDGEACTQDSLLNLSKREDNQASVSSDRAVNLEGPGMRDVEEPGMRDDADVIAPVVMRPIFQSDGGDNILVQCQENEPTDFSDQEEEIKDNVCLSKHEKGLLDAKTTKDTDSDNTKDIESATDQCLATFMWGRTANELKTYVEEFKSLSSVHSSQGFPGENLNFDSYKSISTASHHESNTPMSSKDCFVSTEDQSELIKMDKEANDLKEVSNRERDTNEESLIELSSTSTWVNSKDTAGEAVESGTESVLSQVNDKVINKKATSPQKHTIDNSVIEIWVVQGGSRDNSNTASMPSQVILMEDSFQSSQASIMVSSSRENTSRLDLSTSLSQISQFDLSKLDKSIFSGPPVDAKETSGALQRDSNKFLDNNESITEVFDADGLLAGGERECVYSCTKASRYKDLRSSFEKTNLILVPSDFHGARVTFDLPSASEKSHCRSRSLPRRRYSSRAMARSMHRSISVSPERFKQPETTPQFTRHVTSSPKCSIDIDGSPVRVILEENIGKTETSIGISSFRSNKSNAGNLSLNKSLANNETYSLSEKSGNDTDLFSTQQQSVETNPSSENIDFGIKSTRSISSSSQAECDDQKTMATNIESFHSLSGEYAESSTPLDVQNEGLDNHLKVRNDVSCKSNITNLGAIQNVSLNRKHESKKVIETDSEAFDLCVSGPHRSPSPSSANTPGHQAVSIPRDDDTAWFAYREQFGEFFSPSKNPGCTTEPPTDASDFKYSNSVRSSAADRLRIKNSGKTSVSAAAMNMPASKTNDVSVEDISVTRSQSFPKVNKPICIPSSSEINLSLPRVNNEAWFVYRKHYEKFFQSSSVNNICINQRHNSEYGDTTVCSEVFSTKATSRLDLHSPITCTESISLDIANEMQETATNNLENETALPNSRSSVQNLLRENREADLEFETCQTELEMYHNSKPVGSHVTEEKGMIALGDANSSPPHSHVFKAIPNQMSPEVKISPSNQINEERKDKPIDTLIPIPTSRDNDVNWFRYRKKWSNLFSEDTGNDTQSTYKPYVINNTRFRRAMMKEDFDEPSRKTRAADTSLRNMHTSENHLNPTTNSNDIVKECIADVSATGDSAVCAKEDSSKRSTGKSKKRKVPTVMPSRETVVGVVLQDGFHVHPAQGGSDVCGPAGVISSEVRPPMSPANRPRERSLPRVRHTKRSIDSNRGLPAHETTNDSQPSSPDLSMCRSGGLTLPQLGQRITLLPDIQPELTRASSNAATPLASGSCVSQSSSLFLECSQTQVLQGETTRSPNAKRPKRVKRDPLQPSQRGHVDQKLLPELLALHKTHVKPSEFPASDEAGEGDLLDEAVGGFEEASLIDNDNLLFIKGVSIGEQQDSSVKILSQFNRQMCTPGIDNSNRIGGGDDAGALRETIESLMQPPPEMANAVPPTDIQVMAVQHKFKDASSFLRNTIPRRQEHSKKKLELPGGTPKIRRVPTQTWDVTFTPITSFTEVNNTETHPGTPPLEHAAEPENTFAQLMLEEEKKEKERQKRKLREKMLEQQLCVQRLVSTVAVNRRNSCKNSEDTTSKNSFSKDQTEETSTETKAGGDKGKKLSLKNKLRGSAKSQDQGLLKRRPDMESRRMSSRTLAPVARPAGSLTSPGRIASVSPVTKLKKKDRPKVPPRRVLAEGHYHHDSNVISVVVKPVNIKMDREQLNLKVQVHRKPPEPEAPVPHPPAQKKPSEERTSFRKLRFRRPSPDHLPVLARNIIDVRAVNPPFNTTMSPEAHRRFQATYRHHKIL